MVNWHQLNSSFLRKYVLFHFELVPDMAKKGQIPSPGELSLKYNISLQKNHNKDSLLVCSLCLTLL